MPDTTKKYQIQQKQEDGMLTLHPETEASVVTLDNVAAGMSATNVQDAFKEVMETMGDITGGGVVTGVKGDKETEYRMGQVNLTPANIGAVAENAPITAGTATKITYDAKGLVTAGTKLTATDIPDLGGTYVKQSEKGVASGVASLDGNGQIPVAQIPTLGYIPTTDKGTANGVASLGADGRVPSSQLPSYVDDVIEGYYYNNQFYSDEAHQQQITPEKGKIYVDVDTNKTYRWGGTTYAQLDAGLVLGTTTGTAYDGGSGQQNATNIANIISGNQNVGKATSVTTNIGTTPISDIFEDAPNSAKVKNATHADSADTANTATTAGSANTAAKLSTPRAISLTGDVTGSANFDGSAPASIAAVLANVGTKGTYSVVTTDAKGRVTAGGQILEVGATGQPNPSATLAVGGIFFKEI